MNKQTSGFLIIVIYLRIGEDVVGEIDPMVDFGSLQRIFAIKAGRGRQAHEKPRDGRV